MPSISCRNYFFNFILVQTWLIFHKNGFALSFILKVEVLKLENGLFFRIFSNGSLRLFSDMCAWSLTSIPMVWVKTTILADSMRITKLSKKINSERKEMLLGSEETYFRLVLNRKNFCGIDISRETLWLLLSSAHFLLRYIQNWRGLGFRAFPRFCTSQPSKGILWSSKALLIT